MFILLLNVWCGTKKKFHLVLSQSIKDACQTHQEGDVRLVTCSLSSSLYVGRYL